MFRGVDFYLKLEVRVGTACNQAVEQHLDGKIRARKEVHADAFCVVTVGEGVDRVGCRSEVGKVDDSLFVRIERFVTRIDDDAGISIFRNRIFVRVVEEEGEGRRNRLRFDAVGLCVCQKFVGLLDRVGFAACLRGDGYGDLSCDAAEFVDVVRTEKRLERFLALLESSGCQNYRLFPECACRLVVCPCILLFLFEFVTFDLYKDFLDICAFSRDFERDLVGKGADFRDVRSCGHVASVKDLNGVGRCVECVDDADGVCVAVDPVEYHVCSLKKAVVEVFDVLAALEDSSCIAQREVEGPEEIELFRIAQTAVHRHEVVREDVVRLFDADLRSAERDVAGLVQGVDFAAVLRLAAVVEPCADKLVGRQELRDSAEVGTDRRGRDVVREDHHVPLARDVFFVQFGKACDCKLRRSRIVCRRASEISQRDHCRIEQVGCRRASVVCRCRGVKRCDRASKLKTVPDCRERSLAARGSPGFQAVVELRDVEDVFDQVDVPLVAYRSVDELFDIAFQLGEPFAGEVREQTILLFSIGFIVFDTQTDKFKRRVALIEGAFAPLPEESVEGCPERVRDENES